MRRLAAVLAATALAVTACGGDEDPAVTTTPAVDPTTATETATPPMNETTEPTDEMTEPTEVDPEAAAQDVAAAATDYVQGFSAGDATTVCQYIDPALFPEETCETAFAAALEEVSEADLSRLADIQFDASAVEVVDADTARLNLDNVEGIDDEVRELIENTGLDTTWRQMDGEWRLGIEDVAE